MARLFVLVEGETEETFVNELLGPHLYGKGFESVSAKLMGNSRLRSQRGGVRPWPSVKTEIVRHLRTDVAILVTTMVDYYGIPSDPDKTKAWPGRWESATLVYDKKAVCVESSRTEEIESEIGDTRRFIPFVVMHEFEGLLFSDCNRLAAGVGRRDLATEFQAIRDGFNSPEEINDSQLTHPSRRIVELLPAYQKPVFGNIAALEIGLDRIRSECPYFREWLERLESLT